MADHSMQHRPAQRAAPPAPAARIAGPRQARMEALEASLNSTAPVQRAADRTGLPPQLKAGVETLSGMSMDHVRVHYNSAKPAQMQAHAYAQGSNIHVAPGQERHLPHEAWHVVQQAQGRVRPTAQLKAGVPINDDKHLEREADAMGAKAIGMPAQRSPISGMKRLSAATGTQPVQRTVHVTYNPSLKVTPRKRIGTVAYTRNGGPVSAAKTWLLANGAVAAKPAGAAANHSKPHLAIATAINNDLTGRRTINQVSRAVKGWYQNLFNNVQAPNAFHQGVLDDMSDTRTNPERDANVVDDALDWYLTRIADYPGNLFFWPNQNALGGGVNQPGDPDVDAALIAGGGVRRKWTYRHTRAAERTRVEDGRATLTAQGL